MPTKGRIDRSPNNFEEEFADYLKLYIHLDAPSDYICFLHFQAWKYLQKGAVENRIKDYFEVPDSPFDEGEFRKGCEQMLEWCGYHQKNPFQLSISSMDNLMQNFHFQMIEQRAIAQDSDSILDELVYEHQIVKSRIILYNLVHYKYCTIP